MRHAARWLIGCMAAVLLIAPFFAPYGEEEQHRSRAQEAPAWHRVKGTEPGRTFLLGTDEYGRDIFSRFLYGGRLSLGGGLAATLLALIIGLVLGGAAGLGGAWVDGALMRTSELFLSLPWLYLLLALRAILPLRLAPSGAFWLVVIVIGLAGWARPARLIRGMVLSAQQRPYVSVARAMGGGNVYIFVRHILPQLRGLLWAQALVIFPQFVLADMALSFLGFGAAEPTATWGGMVAGLRRFAVMESHWGRVAPVVLMMVFFIAIQMLAQDEGEDDQLRMPKTIQ